MKKNILMIILFFVFFGNCGANEAIPGLTKEVEDVFAGFWVREPVLNKRLAFWNTSWGRIQGSRFGILVDFADKEMQILSEDGGIAVLEVELYDNKTLRMRVKGLGITEIEKKDHFIIMHLLDDPQYMWIETEGASTGGGQYFSGEGPDRIFMKAAGPGMPIPPIRENEWINDAP